MKRLLLLLVVCVLIASLVGCGESKTISVNVENKDDLSSGVFGIESLIEIGGGLWYDSSTRIVYWWNGYFMKFDYDTAPTPYYAPNGMPYRYNPSTNTFEEIKG